MTELFAGPSYFELKIDALICLDVRIVCQSKLTTLSSLSVNLVSYGTVLCLTHRDIVN